MSVTTSNLILGPADMYMGLFAGDNKVTEPGDSNINDSPSGSAYGYSDVGGTNGGIKLTINQGFTSLDVDQIVDVPERRISSRDFTVTTNMAEATLDNLQLLMNDSVVTTGASTTAVEPVITNSAASPTYRAAIFDGIAPFGNRRRVIVRKVLNTADIDTSFQKDNQTFWAVNLSAHYVSSTVAPFKITDDTTEPS